MSKALDIDTLHKYLLFLAGQVRNALSSGAEEEGVAWMHIELNTLAERCVHADLPARVVEAYLKLHQDYRTTSSEIPLHAALIDGLVQLITHFSFNNARKQRQLEVLHGLKTDLEGLAMHIKMNY